MWSRGLIEQVNELRIESFAHTHAFVQSEEATHTDFVWKNVATLVSLKTPKHEFVNIRWLIFFYNMMFYFLKKGQIWLVAAKSTQRFICHLSTRVVSMILLFSYLVSHKFNCNIFLKVWVINIFGFTHKLLVARSSFHGLQTRCSACTFYANVSDSDSFKSSMIKSEVIFLKRSDANYIISACTMEMLRLTNSPSCITADVQYNSSIIRNIHEPDREDVAVSCYFLEVFVNQDNRR
jgi:hypothetical protein